MIKAAFFDIDGTLVSFNTHIISPSTVEAIHELRQKGVKVFIATGRHPLWINNLADLEIDGYVSLNGGYCTTVEGEVLYKHPMDPTDIRSLLEYQKKEAFPVSCVMEDAILMNFKNESVNKVYNQLNISNPEFGDLESIADKPIYQLIAFFTADQEGRIMEHLPHSEATRWNPYFADVVPKGSNKAVGIDHIIQHYGIKIEETMAFGDGGNDIAMLEHAGIGVAMGNAADEVKAAADYVTTSVDEDGVRQALLHFGLITE